MAKYVMTENERRIVDGVSIPSYFNDNIVPNYPGTRRIAAEKPSTICPFHTDTDPSFHYWKEKGMFRCFGCGVAGNVVSLKILWEKTHNQRFIDRPTAIKELGNQYGIELELTEAGEVKTESVFDIAKKKLNNKQYEVNTFDMNNLTIAGFRTFNNQVKSNIARSPYIRGEQAARLYHSLDLTLSANLASKKEEVRK